MAYTIDNFPFSTDTPQIEVELDEGTYELELIVEDSAGLRSLPDTVVVTVQREEVPNTTIEGIEPVSGLAGNTITAMISGAGLSDATAVTFYRQTSVTRPTLPTVILPPRLRIPDSTISAEITGRGETGIRVAITLSETSEAGVRTFSVTTPNGTVHSGTMTFNVIRRLPTPTITITRPTATITIPTATITRPTATITIPTATITRPTATLTIPTATITRPTATLTIPTATITRPTATLTIPTATITRPTATLTLPTATITRPTATIPTATLTRPTATIPTATLTRPTMTIATGTTLTRPIISGESVMLTSVKGVGAATADKLTAVGIGSVSALASANAKDVAAALGYQDITRAQTLVDEAKKLMG